MTARAALAATYAVLAVVAAVLALSIQARMQLIDKLMDTLPPAPGEPPPLRIIDPATGEYWMEANGLSMKPKRYEGP